MSVSDDTELQLDAGASQDQTAQKTRYCSKCKRPVKGHKGQTGGKCTNTPAPSGNTTPVATNSSNNINNDDGAAMRSVIEQFNAINASIKSLSAELAAIRSTVQPSSVPQLSSVAPLQPAQPSSVAPLQPAQPSSVAPLQPAQPSSVAPLQPAQPSSVAPLQPAQPSSVAPLQPAQPSSVAPVQPAQPSSVAPLQPAQPGSVAPVQAAPEAAQISSLFPAHTMSLPVNSSAPQIGATPGATCALTLQQITPASCSTTSMHTTGLGIRTSMLPDSTTLPSEKLQHQISNGMYTNFSDLLTMNKELNDYPEYESYIDSGVLKFRQKRNQKTIDNFRSWLTAWTVYEMVLVKHYPVLYPVLVQYRQLIQQCDLKFNWQAVRHYDEQFRLSLANRRSLDFGTINTNLYTMIFDSTAIKQSTRPCYRCRSRSHHVKDCPFPERAPMEENKTAPAADSQYHRGQEICNNYQQERCRYPQCKRAHVCKACRGPHPENKCTDSQKPAQQ
jgi:hypothetical protein